MVVDPGLHLSSACWPRITRLRTTWIDRKAPTTIYCTSRLGLSESNESTTFHMFDNLWRSEYCQFTDSNSMSWGKLDVFFFEQAVGLMYGTTVKHAGAPTWRLALKGGQRLNPHDRPVFEVCTRLSIHLDQHRNFKFSHASSHRIATSTGRANTLKSCQGKQWRS